MADSDSTDGGPSGGKSRGPGEVQLCIVIPTAVRESVRAAAKRDGVTVRTFVLQALRMAGVSEVKDEELVDRRAVIAALKAQLFRNAKNSGNIS